MDLHVLWLRRFVAGRAAARLAVETVVLAAMVGIALVLLGVGPAAAAGLALAATPLYGAARVASAITGNPLDHQYLTKWRDASSRLVPMPDAGRGAQANDRVLAGIGLQPLTRLGLDNGSATTVAYEVYRSPSRLVLVSVEATTGLLTAISRLADGRLLVTCDDFIPPGVEVLVNTPPPYREGSTRPVADLVMHHVDQLDHLTNLGLLAVPAGHELVVTQVRLEWHAWQLIGPFIGPLIAVDRRRLPYLLRVSPPRDELWERGLDTDIRQFIRYRFRGPTPPDGPASRTPEITVDIPHPTLRTSASKQTARREALARAFGRG